MTTSQARKTTDSIALAGDDAVFKFGAYCMRLLDGGHDVTAEDAQDFLDSLTGAQA